MLVPSGYGKPLVNCDIVRFLSNEPNDSTNAATSLEDNRLTARLLNAFQLIPSKDLKRKYKHIKNRY